MASPPQTGKMNADDARYIRQVIDEEHTKPLEVTDNLCFLVLFSFF